MATTHQVTVAIVTPAGDPAPSRPVRATLVGWDDTTGEYVRVAGFVDDGIQVPAVDTLTNPATADTDPGAVVLDLVANTDITPAGTYWRVTVGPNVWVIDVTGPGTVETLLVDTPTPFDPSALATHLASGRHLPDPAGLPDDKMVATLDEEWVVVDAPEGGGGGPQGPPGDSAYEVAVGNGFVGTEEEWLESLVGPEGPQGEQGPAGAQGPPGDEGPQGPQGEQGPAGEDGDDGAQGPQGDPGDSHVPIPDDPGDDGKVPVADSGGYVLTDLSTLMAAYSGQYAVNTVAASGATETLPATHAAHHVTMDQACEFTFSAPTAGHTFLLWLAGAFTPTFPASVDWHSGTPPTYADDSLYQFTTMDGGTTWLGALVASGLA